jgi:phage I-like protein
MKSKLFKPARSQSVAFAACSFALNANGEVQLLPAGEFSARDGRPTECACWLTNAEIAANIIADIALLANPVVIDYEHQTLLSAENGKPAPAAGWFTAADMEWREVEGLFARVEWTDAAKLHIEAKEYRFLSPVILYDRKTGAIKKIINAALTNNAAIDGMEEVSARLSAVLTKKESLTMGWEELLEQLRWMLNLPTLATKEEVVAELQKAVALIKSGQPEAVAAAGFSIAGLISSLGSQVAALKSASPDPAKYVPLEVMQALQTELSTLRSEQVDREVDGVVAAALSVGKLLPAQEAWARELGKANLTLLKQHVDTAQQITALTGLQTGNKPPKDLPQGELSESELAMCRNTGVSPEDFKKTKLDIA